MFYEPGNDHGLPHDPFKACVVPRAIGWISTRSVSGIDNLAPYSQFTNLTFDPPYVMFSSNRTVTGQRKDSVINAEATGVFNWNLATWHLREAMNITAQQFAPDVDEFTAAGLEKEAARLSDAPLVKESPVRFECAFHSAIVLPGNPPMGTVDVVIGRVLAVHINDKVLTDGKIDVSKTLPIARCGYYEYAVVRETFEMKIPGDSKEVMYGLEGSARANREQGNKGKTEGEVETEVNEAKGQLERSQSTGAEGSLS